MASRRVVVIGLDSFDPDLAARWAAEGELPVLAGLFDRGARSVVRNPHGLPGCVWVSFASALEPVRHRTHSWSEIDVASYRWRVAKPRNDLYDAFWKRIAEAGRRVLAIDVPYGRAAGHPACVELFEWGAHDRHFGLHASPPHRADEVEARFGLHPVFGVNARREWHYTPDDFLFRRGKHRTLREEGKLLASLVAGAGRKGDLMLSLLGEEEWDLFVGVFCESHSVGHQFWHLHDPTHVRFEAARRDRLGDPLLKTYRAIDAEIGRLAEAAGGNADLFVYLSNGMGSHYDGTALLDEVLERIEGHDSGEGVGAIRGAVKPWLPKIRDLAIRSRIPIPIRLPLARWLRGDQAANRAQRRYYVEPNNTVFSGIRLNLVGREPLGKIRRDEVDAVCAALTEDLMALVNVDSGGPAVRGVHRCDDHHRRESDDCLPDLFVEWERSVPIEAVGSPKIGIVRIPYSRIRTGDHRPDGLLLAVGPDFEPAAEMPSIAVEDIGPSLAARFGVTLDDVDGEMVPWLTESSRLSGPVPLTAEARR